MRGLRHWQTFLRKLLRQTPGRRKSRGQSLVELALFLPILLILLSGLVEFGFGLNRYVNVVEATREGARSGVDGDPALRDLIFSGGAAVSNTDCDTSRDYYSQIACRVERAAQPVTLDPAQDDIIITVVRTYRDPRCEPEATQTPPPVGDCSSNILPDPHGLWPVIATPKPGDTPLPGAGTWSGGPGRITKLGQWIRYGNWESEFDRAELQAYIDNNPQPLSAGILVVETFYYYELVLKLPWITPFVGLTAGGEPAILFRTYTVVPLPAGEPRATPTNTPTPTPTPTFTPTPPPLNCVGNGVYRELYYGIPGSGVTDVLTGTNNFTNAPHANVLQTIFESPTNITDTYGSRYRALLCAPVNGDYTFWIAADNGAELRFDTASRTLNPGTFNWTLAAGSGTRIAYVPDGSATGFNNFTTFPEQSGTLTGLQQGWYYIEVLHKEELIDDHVSIQWDPPHTGAQIIPQANLYSVPVGLLPSTATPTPTPTFTPVPPTPTNPCVANVVDVTRSRVIVNSSPQWSDNQSNLLVEAQLLDNCGAAIDDSVFGSWRTVSLTSSRTVSDTIVFNTRVNNIYYFDVRSAFVGASTFTASTDQDGPGPLGVVSFPVAPSTNTGQFVCVAGAQDVSINPNTLQILYTNPNSPVLNRRLVTLSVTSNSGLQVNSVSFGNASNVIWNAGPRALPLTLTNSDWTSVNRSILSGLGRPLQINFNAPITPGSGSWTYTVTAAWDNGTGSSLCTSLPVTVTLP
jgi:hypothetical protein